MTGQKDLANASCFQLHISQLSLNAHRYVSENRLIEQHVEKWEETYLSWVSNRDKLLRDITKIHSYCHFGQSEKSFWKAYLKERISFTLRGACPEERRGRNDRFCIF